MSHVIPLYGYSVSWQNPTFKLKSQIGIERKEIRAQMSAN